MLPDSQAIKTVCSSKTFAKFSKLAFEIVECHRAKLPTSISLAKVNSQTVEIILIKLTKESQAKWRLIKGDVVLNGSNQL